MSKSKHSKPDEFLKEQVRHLKKEIRRKDQQIRQLEKQLGYDQYKDRSKTIYIEDEVLSCQECGKGILSIIDLGIRKITRCSLCAYKKVSK